MLVMPQGVVTGGDGARQGGSSTGRVAVFDFPPTGESVDTEITNPIQGRVFTAGQQVTLTGDARTNSGSVSRVQLEIRDTGSGQYLQDDLKTWGPSNTILSDLASPARRRRTGHWT